MPSPARQGALRSTATNSSVSDYNICALPRFAVHWSCMRFVNPTEIRNDWNHSPRWNGIERPYKAEEVVRLRGTIHIEHTLARLGA